MTYERLINQGAPSRSQSQRIHNYGWLAVALYAGASERRLGPMMDLTRSGYRTRPENFSPWETRPNALALKGR